MFGFFFGGIVALGTGPAEFLPNKFWLFVTGFMCFIFVLSF